MTPKEKAEELVRKYYTFGLNNTAQSFSWYECKQCALIAIDEIVSLMIKFNGRHIEDNSTEIDYLQNVKQEIEKL